MVFSGNAIYINSEVQNVIHISELTIYEYGDFNNVFAEWIDNHQNIYEESPSTWMNSAE